jgi:probable F420-dependent oxidoreductase
MRFSLAETMCDPAQYVPLARAAEEAGFHAYTLPDSIAYPEVSDSKYPYTPDGNRQFLEDKPFVDPFCLASMLGVATQRLRFHTFVVKLPIRHPVLTAKQLASVAVLTGDRFSLGVGLSPWPEDFRLCGVPWEGRGRRMDEMIAIIRGLLRGGFFQFKGTCFDVESIKICPTPARPVPILIGGHSEAALRRAAALGDGWMHAGGDAAEMATMIARLHELRREYGRENEPFEVHVISMDAYSEDGVRRLEDIGVTDAIVGFRKAYEADRMPLEKKVTSIRRYGESIIARASTPTATA